MDRRRSETQRLKRNRRKYLLKRAQASQPPSSEALSVSVICGLQPEPGLSIKLTEPTPPDTFPDSPVEAHSEDAPPSSGGSSCSRGDCSRITRSHSDCSGKTCRQSECSFNGNISPLINEEIITARKPTRPIRPHQPPRNILDETPRHRLRESRRPTAYSADPRRLAAAVRLIGDPPPLSRNRLFVTNNPSSNRQRSRDRALRSLRPPRASSPERPPQRL